MTNLGNLFSGKLSDVKEFRMAELKEGKEVDDVKTSFDDIVIQSAVIQTAHNWTQEIIGKYDLVSYRMYQFISAVMMLCAGRVNEGEKFEEIFKESVEKSMDVLYKFKDPLKMFVNVGLCTESGKVENNFLSDPVTLDSDIIWKKTAG